MKLGDRLRWRFVAIPSGKSLRAVKGLEILSHFYVRYNSSEGISGRCEAWRYTLGRRLTRNQYKDARESQANLENGLPRRMACMCRKCAIVGVRLANACFEGHMG